MMRTEWTGKLWSDPLSIVRGARNSSSRLGGRPSGDEDWEGAEEIDGEERGTGEPSLEAFIGRGRPSCWELLAAVPPGDKPLPATELP